VTWAERKAAEAEAEGNHARAQYYRDIKALVDEAPPFTEEQKAKLRVLLRPAPASVFDRPRIAGDLSEVGAAA
jgi:hypothetical protein